MKRPNSNQKGLDTPLLVVSTKKEAEIQKEVQNQLYRVPQEDEISMEYEEVRKADELNKRWQQLRQEEENQKAQIAQRKLEKLENEQKRLATRLEEIINIPPSNEQEDKYKLIALRRRIEQDYKDEKDKLTEQFMVNKEHEIEKVVRKKIEMEKIIEEKQRKNKELEKLQLQLEAIEDVKNKKDISSKKQLSQALKRLGVAPEMIEDEDKLLLNEALLQERIEDQRQREMVVQEILDKERENKRIASENNKRSIEEQKQLIMQKQERILKEKAIQSEITRRGIDYLTQIELGNAPPIELIRNNIVLDDEKLNEYRLKYNLQQITRRNEKLLQDPQKRIFEIEREQQGDELYEQPYRDQLKPFLSQQSPESLFVARKIIEYVIDQGLRKILDKENKMFMLKQQRDDYANKNKNLKQTQNYLIDREFVDEMADKIFAGVMRKVQREAADEIRKINLIAQQKALEIIFKSVKLERNTTNHIDRIEYIFFKQRGKNLEKLETDVKFNFLNQQQIKWGSVKKGKKNYNTEELMTQMKEKKNLQKGIKPQQKEDQEDEEEDLDVIMLDPEKEQCVETLGLDKFKDIEIQHWERISFQDVNYKIHIPQIKAAITYITISPFKDQLLIGMSNGEVALYNTQTSPGLITALVPSFNKQPIVDIQFGLDNVGHLLILDASGQVRFCYFGFNLKVNIPKEQLKGIEQLPQGFQPMFYVQYFTINQEHLQRRKIKPTEKQLLTICVFHPAITFSCLQPQLFVGSNDGVVMKYNSNVDLMDGEAYKFPIHQVLNTRIIIHEDEEFPQENFLNLKVQEEHEGKNPQVFREFFEGHKAQIVYISFLESPEIILTFDRDGYIFYWEYDTGLYDLRKRSFRPKIKYKLQMAQVSYQPDNANRTKVFPNSETENIIVEGQERYMEYFDDNSTVNKISEKPLRDGEMEVLVCLEDLPEDGDIGIFEIIRVNHAQRQIIEIYQQDFKGQASEGYIAKVKSSLANKFIYMEVIKPHYLHQDLIVVEFIALNTQSFKLKKLKTVIYTTYCESIEFDIVDNYYPFMISYLFAHLPQGIQIISLATGNVLKLIDTHIQRVRVTFSPKILIPKGIQVIENDCVFYTYQNANGCWKLRIQDDNDENDEQSIYSFYRFEYEKLFLQ